VNRKISRLLVAAVVFLLALTACLPGKGITDADQEAVLAYVEPITDRVLDGIESGDFALFSQDFNDQMLEVSTEESFQQLRDLLSTKVGTYQSREVSSVRDVDGTLLVIYTAVYSKAKQVVIQISVTGSEPHQVAGLYFTSPELNK
jgi:hypothetical protein